MEFRELKKSVKGKTNKKLTQSYTEIEIQILLFFVLLGASR